MTDTNNNQTPSKNIFGTLAELFKNTGNATRRPSGGAVAGRRSGNVGGSRPQPKKPCGGCK
jgi:hypothetical protein